MNTKLFTHREVSKTLRACENTATGTDEIIYNHLKQIDPKAQTLILMYNLCLKFQDVPAAWKRTTNISIYKKRNKNNPGNWRPIALGNTIYKLYDQLPFTSALQVAGRNYVLSFYQKLFLPHGGFFENNYILDNTFRKFTKKKKYFFSHL